jgi:hypothetical protein
MVGRFYRLSTAGVTVRLTSREQAVVALNASVPLHRQLACGEPFALAGQSDVADESIC